jgi:hypothetical protein
MLKLVTSLRYIFHCNKFFDKLSVGLCTLFLDALYSRSTET